jgi:hypothetical protein
MGKSSNLILIDKIEPLIFTFRGQKVLLDRDLAALYGVATKVLNQAVKRNIQRFPDDFMFQMSPRELEEWRSQFVTSNSAAKMGLRRPPFAFTEYGAIMAATILNSSRAVEVSVFVVRAFVRLRQWMASHQELSAKLNELDKKVAGHDDAIRQLVTGIRKLMSPPHDDRPKRRIGF